MDWLNLSDVEEFVKTLELEYQRIWEWVRYEARERDTGSHEFQVAARIEDAFWNQASHVTGKPLARSQSERA